MQTHGLYAKKSWFTWVQQEMVKGFAERRVVALDKHIPQLQVH